MNLYACMSPTYVGLSMEARFPAAGVTGGCEPSNMGAGMCELRPSRRAASVNPWAISIKKCFIDRILYSLGWFQTLFVAEGWLWIWLFCFYLTNVGITGIYHHGYFCDSGGLDQRSVEIASSLPNELRFQHPWLFLVKSTIIHQCHMGWTYLKNEIHSPYTFSDTPTKAFIIFIVISIRHLIYKWFFKENLLNEEPYIHAFSLWLWKHTVVVWIRMAPNRLILWMFDF